MRKINVIVTAICTVLLFFSCATTLDFGISQITPAAEGTAKIAKGKNGNYVLTVKVINLTDPQRLTPPKRFYSIWTESMDGNAKNMGMIKMSSGLLSKTMKGSFKTVCITKPIKVFITAEDNGDVEYPGEMVVLKTE